MKKEFTSAEAAEVLGFTARDPRCNSLEVSNVHRLGRLGKIKEERRIGRMVLWNAKSVLKYKSERDKK